MFLPKEMTKESRTVCHKPILISIWTLVCLLLTHPLSLMSFPSAESFTSVHRKPAEQIQVPTHLGTTQETKGTTSDSRTIVFVHDAHTSTEAQKNIQAILHYLKSEYGLNSFFLEGTLQTFNPKIFRFFQSSDANRRLHELFAKDGLVGGGELFLADLSTTESAPDAVFASENPSYYEQNLKLFKEILESGPMLDGFFNEMDAAILSEASRIFNPELLSFFKEWIFLSSNGTELINSLDFLSTVARNQLSLDFSSPLTQIEWPQLTRLYRSQDLEQHVNQQEFQDEKEGIVQQLSAADESAAVQEIVQALYNPPGQRLEWLRGFLKNSSDAIDYARIAQKYPAFASKTGALILKSEIDSKNLFVEIHLLHSKILEKLSKTDREENLLALNERILYLKKLLRLELTPEEYNSLVEEEKTFLPSLIFSKKESLLPNTTVSNLKTDLRAMDQIYRKAIAFYAVARLRDGALLAHALHQLEMSGEKTGVLVAGGFHADGIRKKCLQKGVRFIEIKPRIENPLSDSAYLKAMAHEGHFLTARSFVKPFPIQSIPSARVFRDQAHARQLTQYLYGMMNAALATIIASELRAKENASGSLHALLSALNRTSAAAFFHFQFYPNGVLVAGDGPVESREQLGRFIGVSVRGPASFPGDALPLFYQMNGRPEMRSNFLNELLQLRTHLYQTAQAFGSIWTPEGRAIRKAKWRFSLDFLMLRRGSLDDFIRYLSKMDHPSDFQEGLRTDFMEAYHLPDTTMIFLPPSATYAWALVSGQKPQFGGNQISVRIEQGYHAVFSNAEGHFQHVIAIRNDLNEAETLAALVQTAVKSKISAATYTHEPALSEFERTTLDGIEQYFRHELLQSLISSHSAVGNRTRNIVNSYLTGFQAELSRLRLGEAVHPSADDLAVEFFLGQFDETRIRSPYTLNFAKFLVSETGKPAVEHGFIDRNFDEIRNSFGGQVYDFANRFFNFWAIDSNMKYHYGSTNEALYTAAFRIIEDVILKQKKTSPMDMNRLIQFTEYAIQVLELNPVAPDGSYVNHRALVQAAIRYLDEEVSDSELLEILDDVYHPHRQEMRTEAAAFTPLSAESGPMHEIPIVDELDVSIAAYYAGGVLEAPKAVRLTPKELNVLMVPYLPDVFAVDRSKELDHYTLLNPAKADRAHFSLSVIFEEIPDINDPRIQVIIDLLSHNRWMKIQITAPPDADSIAFNALNNEIIRTVLAKRPAHIRSGVNINPAYSETDVEEFVNETKGKSVVFDSQGNIAPHIGSRIKKTNDTLLVLDNASLEQKAVALLAAVNTVIERNQLPEGVQNALDLLNLTENLALAQRVAEAVAQAA